jgi:hypothetical protein
MIEKINKVIIYLLGDTLWYLKIGWDIIEVRHTHYPKFEHIKNIKSIEIWQNRKTGEIREVIR